MKQNIESIQEFYDRLSITDSIDKDNGAGHFNAFPRRYCAVSACYHRRDFYKISLLSEGTGIIHYADKDIVIDRPGLFFSNPRIPHSWEATSAIQEGWFCLFSESFIQSWNHSMSIQDYPMFRMEENPVIFLDNEVIEDVSYIFRKMINEMSSDYIYKYSKLRNYLQLLIHEALKYHPEVGLRSKQLDASHRITYRFLELLESQFPIENTDMPVRLKTVQDYAAILSVHENHLNHTVKEVTGKNPSQHIAARITEEAKALLQNTDWTIAEIAYSLKFEYPSHFSSFLKKSLGITPKEYRNAIL